jgi:hypothetical protein
MVGERPTDGWDGYGEDDEGLAALDFYASDQAEDTDPDISEVLAGFAPAEEPEDGPREPVFSVTNPPGTVTVVTSLDGAVQRIRLSPEAARMTERELADEIVVVASLATQDAKSAQYTYMLEGLRQQGHDDAATRDFLTRDLDLPSPEQARSAQAQIFATRYSSDHV